MSLAKLFCTVAGIAFLIPGVLANHAGLCTVALILLYAGEVQP